MATLPTNNSIYPGQVVWMDPNAIYTGTATAEPQEPSESVNEKFAQELRTFVKEMSKVLEDNGIPANTVGFVNALDIKAPRFDKGAVMFFEEYSEEVKERILNLIQDKYQALVENHLGLFLRLYSQQYQRLQHATPQTYPQYTWSNTASTSKGFLGTLTSTIGDMFDKKENK